MKKILIYNSGGGLGDTIQIFTLILSLKNHFKSSEFFYISAHENHFINKLKEFKINIKTLDLNIKYFGFRWWHYFFAKKNFKGNNLEDFDLIIDLQSKLRNTIILKQIPHKYFYSTTFKFRFCTNKADYTNKDHLKNLNRFFDTEILKKIFKLSDLSIEYLEEAKNLLPKSNYVGFTMTQGNTYRKKSWSLDKFIILANKISEKNKIPVFFIEKENILLINNIKSQVPNALFPEHQSKISCPALVTALASRLDMAISIDNGVMHMISLAKIPMITLFGPTNSEKFSPNNEQINVIDSKKIYNSKDINKITVDDIFNLI